MRRYREKARHTKRAVAAAKARPWEEWSEELYAREGRMKMFKIMIQMKKERKDITGARYIKDETGNIIVKEEEITERWKSYFDELLNEANECHLQEESKVEWPIRGVTEEEMEGLLKNMKNGKAPGPSGVTSDLLKGAGVTGVKKLTKAYERIEEEERVPE